jgi:succinoglycan biosynthesis transport protein ExoP
MTLAFAMRALRRHIVLVLITVVVVTGAGIALGSYLPKTYSSNARILLGLDPLPRSKSPKTLQGATIDPQTANLYLKERAMTYAQLVTADDVITPVATAAAIDPEMLRGRVVAAIVPETVVLDLRVTGSSPEEAVALTQALSDRFRVQVSVLNVQTGGPVILTAQISAPKPAAAPDQLHGKTLAVVSALVGVIVAVLLALLAAVIKRNRAASRPQPRRTAFRRSRNTTLTTSRRRRQPPRVAMARTVSDHRLEQLRLRATSRTKGPSK